MIASISGLNAISQGYLGGFGAATGQANYAAAKAGIETDAIIVAVGGVNVERESAARRRLDFGGASSTRARPTARWWLVVAEHAAS